MNNEIIKINSSIQSYIEKNREKLDEALVSLRLIKEVDTFLDNNSISNKELAINLGYSQSFISQLMSGVKKINTSFINKFEKTYNVRVIFTIEKQDTDDIFKTISSNSFLYYKFDKPSLNIHLNKNSPINYSKNYTEYEEYAEYEEV